jgi:hypothetical protein
MLDTHIGQIGDKNTCMCLLAHLAKGHVKFSHYFVSVVCHKLFTFKSSTISADRKNFTEKYGIYVDPFVAIQLQLKF